MTMSDAKRYTNVADTFASRSSQGIVANNGQALVMILMIVALTVSLAGTTVFRIVNDTRTTKETEEKQKTENVAKGIIEKFLNDETVTLDEFTSGSLKTDVAPVQKRGYQTSEYVSKIIPKDSQHFFYIWPYDYTTKTFTNPGYPNPINVDIFFQSEASECPVLEIIHIGSDADSTITKRQVTGPCGANEITGNPTNILTVSNTNTPLTFLGESGTFLKRVTVTGITQTTKMIVVRTVFAGTRIGMKMNTVGEMLPPQGEYIVATARSAGGAQTDERVYRPYPQIPDYFFATSF